MCSWWIQKNLKNKISCGWVCLCVVWCAAFVSVHILFQTAFQFYLKFWRIVIWVFSKTENRFGLRRFISPLLTFWLGWNRYSSKSCDEFLWITTCDNFKSTSWHSQCCAHLTQRPLHCRAPLAKITVFQQRILNKCGRKITWTFGFTTRWCIFKRRTTLAFFGWNRQDISC